MQDLSFQTDNSEDFLYKYMTIPNFRLLLENGGIKATNPYYFNDPMDCKFPLLSVNIDKSYSFYMSNEEGILNHEFNHVHDEITKSRCMKFLLDELKINTENILRYIHGRWLNEIQRIRVISFSENKCSDLLWSHYGDSHNGVLLSFPKELSFGTPTKVSYVKTMHDINFYLETKMNDMIIERAKSYLCKTYNFDVNAAIQELIHETTGFSNRMIFTKKIDWSYEEEYRLAFIEDDDRVRNIKENVDVVDFKLTDIIGVTIGLNVNYKEARAIKNLIISHLPNSFIKKNYLNGWDIISNYYD